MIDEKLHRYLTSNENGYVKITPKIRKKAKEITADADTPYEVAKMNYNYVRSRPYFFTPSNNVDDLLDKKTLDCGSKSVLLTSLNRSMGIPSRIAIMECPMNLYMSTLEHMYIPPIAKALGSTVLDIVSNNILGGGHYAVESYYDNEWHLMDPSLNPEACEYFTDEKKEICLSEKNVSGMLECRMIGHSEDLPSNGVILSSLGRLMTDITGATQRIFKGTDIDVSNDVYQLSSLFE